jgi:plasmid stabilization system protein ParE
MNILLTRSAEQDLLDGHGFYERQAPGVGTYFLDSLFADIDSLVLYAGIHPKIDGRFYRTLAKRFPYAVYYRIEGELVTVVAILDCRQNPIRIQNTLIERQ